MHRILAALSINLALNGNVLASTVLIGFENVAPGSFASPQKKLAGLHWQNFGVIAASYASGPTGLAESVVSTPNVAFNLDPALPSTFIGRDFGFLDAWFGSWQDPLLQITVIGNNRLGQIIDLQTFYCDTAGPILKIFNWSGLYSVSISDSSEAYSRYSIDDVRLSTNIQEPISFAVMGIGLLGLVAARTKGITR